MAPLARERRQGADGGGPRGPDLRGLGRLRALPRRAVREVEGLAARPRHAGGRPAHGAGGFSRRPLRAGRRRDDILDSRWQVLRPHGGRGRQTRRVRGHAHVRRGPAPAVSARAARRAAPGADHRLGHAPEGAGRAAVVLASSRRAHSAGRRAALDGAPVQLEFGLRRLPLHLGEEGLQPRRRSLRDHMGGAQRGLRGVSRPGFGPRGLGGRRPEREGVRGRREGPGRGARRAQGRDVDAGLRHGRDQPEPPACLLGGDRRLRAVPQPPRPGGGRVRGRAAARGSLSAGAPGAAALLPRRPAARGGVRLGLVPLEPHASARRHVRGLPRAARRRAARARQRGVPPVPRPRALRHKKPSSPRCKQLGVPPARPATCPPPPTW
jgi:hypothetical protein